MSKRLKIARLDEVSFVDRGANQKAFVTLWKRAAEKPVKKARTFDELRGAREAYGDLSEMASDLISTVDCAMYDPEVTDKAGFIAQCFEQFSAAFNAALPTWTGTAMDKQEKAEKIGLIQKFAQALGLAPEVVVKNTNDDGGKPVADKPETPAVPAVGTVAKAEMEALTKRLEKAEADAAANAEKVTKMEIAKRTADFVKQAEGYTALPIKAAEFGPILRKIADGEKLDEKELTELNRVLSAANEVGRVGKIFGEAGSNAAEGSATAQVAAEVKKMRDVNPKLSEASARGQVYKNDPKLRAAVEAEDAERASR